VARLVDLLELCLWYAVVGFAACGAAWCGGYGNLADSLKDLRPRVCRDREVRRECARGLAQIGRYLDEQPV
jgi:hypothetical protein